MTKVSWQYIAGFFDGEGSISISRYTRSDGGVSHKLVVELGASKRDILDDILETVEAGAIFRSPGGRWNGRPHDFFRLQLQTAAARRFLSKVLPILRIKRTPAQIGLEFQSTMLKPGAHPLPPEVFDAREALKSRLEQANRPRLSANKLTPKGDLILKEAKST